MVEVRLRPGKWILAVLPVWLCLPLAVAAQVAASPAAGGQPAAAAGQDAAAQLPAFEVVSIKPDKSGAMMMRVMFTSDGISITNLPVHMLLREAFGVSDNQLIGEPGWLNSAHFDIEAKVAAEDVPKLKALKPAEHWAMLLPVFADRFGLKYHHEKRDLTQYVLVVARGGPKLKEAAPGETYTNGLTGPDGKSSGGMVRMMPGNFIGQGTHLDTLVHFLSFQFHSPVTDKTGLTGLYDIDLKWTPDEMGNGMMRPPDGGQPEGQNPAPASTTGPSLFTALEEQLGLKLEAHKEPGDAIVIDHIEQPSPN